MHSKHILGSLIEAYSLAQIAGKLAATGEKLLRSTSEKEKELGQTLLDQVAKVHAAAVEIETKLHNYKDQREGN